MGQLEIFDAGQRLEVKPSKATPAPCGSGPAGETCKTCKFATQIKHHDAKYWKCGQVKHWWTHGPGSDIRLKWAACREWQALKEARAVKTGAAFSPCKLYRTRLWRTWCDQKPKVNFLMLNPSTADEIENDPTVERCQRRAESMGFGGLIVTNIFAFRSTDPAGLLSVADPVGSGNDAAILQAAEVCEMVVCAWGEHGGIRQRSTRVRELLWPLREKLHYLRRNASGEPAHPLYLSYELQPTKWGL